MRMRTELRRELRGLGDEARADGAGRHQEHGAEERPRRARLSRGSARQICRHRPVRLACPREAPLTRLRCLFAACPCRHRDSPSLLGLLVNIRNRRVGEARQAVAQQGFGRSYLPSPQQRSTLGVHRRRHSANCRAGRLISELCVAPLPPWRAHPRKRFSASIRLGLHRQCAAHLRMLRRRAPCDGSPAPRPPARRPRRTRRSSISQYARLVARPPTSGCSGPSSVRLISSDSPQRLDRRRASRPWRIRRTRCC